MKGKVGSAVLEEEWPQTGGGKERREQIVENPRVLGLRVFLSRRGDSERFMLTDFIMFSSECDRTCERRAPERRVPASVGSAGIRQPRYSCLCSGARPPFRNKSRFSEVTGRSPHSHSAVRAGQGVIQRN